MTFQDSRLPKRFWDKVKIVDCVLRPELGPCWEWKGACNSEGYGSLIIGSRTDGSRRTILAHRFAYQTLIDSIIPELEPDHLCRNHSCVNPHHLEIVTHHTNVIRGLAGAHEKIRTHCPHGHPYDEVNTIIERGRRICRTCRRAKDARRRVRVREEKKNDK